MVLSTQAAHESSDLIVGGAVDPMPQRSLVDWAAYFCEYGQFMLPLTGGMFQNFLAITLRSSERR